MHNIKVIKNSGIANSKSLSDKVLGNIEIARLGRAFLFQSAASGSASS